MNKGIKKNLNFNDSNISENHAIINKIMDDYIKKMLKGC